MESKYESLWMATSKATSFSQLTQNIEVDVAVIGGGIAGLMAAYYLQNEGKKVAVLESFSIVTGTSGYTTAKVTSEHEGKFQILRDTFGLEKTKLYGESQEWAIRALEEIVSKEKIDCGFKRVAAYFYTNEDNQVETVKKEYETAKEIGMPVTYEEHSKILPFPVKAAAKFSNQAIFHPRKFLLAIAELIVKRGGLIFEKSKVTEIKDGEPCEVTTEKGSVKAKNVIIATNYPIYDKGFFFLRIGQMRSYALAIQTEDYYTENIFMGAGKKEFTVRPYEEDGKRWIIIGGEDHHTGDNEETDRHYADLEAEATKKFKVKSIDYRWSAQDASPIDRVPLIGNVPTSRNLYVTTGYSEWGMATSIVSAKLLSDLIQGRKNQWSDLYSPLRLNLKAAAGEALNFGKQVIKGFGDYAAKLEGLDLSELKPNEGKIVNYKGEKIAVHKDSKGKVYAVSAVCTHLGCIVEWNNAETTWDCPCHGSRFTKEGKVIHGPAVEDLATKEVA